MISHAGNKKNWAKKNEKKKGAKEREGQDGRRGEIFWLRGSGNFFLWANNHFLPPILGFWILKAKVGDAETIFFCGLNFRVRFFPAWPKEKRAMDGVVYFGLLLSFFSPRGAKKIFIVIRVTILDLYSI